MEKGLLTKKEREIFSLFEAIKEYLEETGTTQDEFLDELLPYVSNNIEKLIDRSVLGRHLKNPPSSVRKSFFDAAVSFLVDKGRWHVFNEYSQPSDNLFPAFATFFRLRQSSSTFKKLLNGLNRFYEYYQWSSRSPGNIAITRIEITHIKDAPYMLVTENQEVDKEHQKSRGGTSLQENYRGIVFSRMSLIYFMMHQDNDLYPKFCLFYDFDSTGSPMKKLIGVVLKGTNSFHRNYHHSRIVMRIIDKPEDCQPRIVSADHVDKEILIDLKEPLT